MNSSPNRATILKHYKQGGQYGKNIKSNCRAA